MYALLDHPLLGPAYNELARACLPGRQLGPWQSTEPAADSSSGLGGGPAGAAATPVDADDSRKRGLFRR
jgi:hypothetical protein